VLKELLHKKSYKGDKRDKPDILCLSVRSETGTQNTARQHQTTDACHIKK